MIQGQCGDILSINNLSIDENEEDDQPLRAQRAFFSDFTEVAEKAKCKRAALYGDSKEPWGLTTLQDEDLERAGISIGLESHRDYT